MSTTLRRTPLYEQHVSAQARMIEFAGWEMPVQYQGVGVEHRAVREACGVFDVSHMGEIETSGRGALAMLQRVLSNDVSQISLERGVGGAQYSVICREDGGVLDDVFTYRLAEERYLTVTNAANHERDLAFFQEQARDFPEATVSDRIGDYAMLAVQGPRSRAIVQELADGALPGRMSVCAGRLAGEPALVCGTGYTGEEGVELLCRTAAAASLWSELVRRGAVPAGLAARDTLRLEVCFHLYGNDLSIERGPIEAGLGWCCHEETGFIGAAAVRRARESPPAQKLVAFAIEGPGIARPGNRVRGGGEVTSGTMSPSLGIGIGLAYVPTEGAAPGTRLEIDVRGKMRPAVVKEKPLYRRAA